MLALGPGASQRQYFVRIRLVNTFVVRVYTVLSNLVGYGSHTSAPGQIRDGIVLAMDVVLFKNVVSIVRQHLGFSRSGRRT